MKALKTVLYCVLYFILLWLFNIGSDNGMVFCAGFLNLATFAGKLIFLIFLAPIICGVLYWAIAILGGLLIANKTPALIALIWAAAWSVGNAFRWFTAGDWFFVIYGLYAIFSGVFFPAMIYCNAKKEAKEAEIAAIYQKAKEDVINQMNQE